MMPTSEELSLPQQQLPSLLLLGRARGGGRADWGGLTPPPPPRKAERINGQSGKVPVVVDASGYCDRGRRATLGGPNAFQCSSCFDLHAGTCNEFPLETHRCL